MTKENNKEKIHLAKKGWWAGLVAFEINNSGEIFWES